MTHTYLLEEGTWTAQSSLVTEDGQELSGTGESKIVHHQGHWIIDARMGDIRNRYEITPFPPGSRATEWTSENPAMGRFLGMFCIVDDTILSTFKSEDGALSGVESVRMIDADHYENRGALFAGARRISSWTVTLRRVA